MADRHALDQGQDEQERIERWRERQAALAARLEGWGATDGERRIEWDTGRVEWVSPAGEPLAIATMKALCSYDLEGEALLMAWANPGAAQGAVIAPPPEVPEVVEPCSEGEAWLWAMRLADSSGAEFLLRVASPSYLVFLGLWAVQPPLTESDGVLPEGTPQAFVVKLLDTLRHALRDKGNDPVGLRRLFMNQADSLHQSAQPLHADGADPALLKQTVETLLAIGQGFNQRRFVGLLAPPPLKESELNALHKQLLNLRALWLRDENSTHP